MVRTSHFSQRLRFRLRPLVAIGMTLMILLGALAGLPVAASAAPGVSALPATIQAEDYTSFADNSKGNSGKVYRSDDVDIQPTTDALTPGGFNVGWNRSGEWLGYDVVVPTAGEYSLTLRVATPYSNGSFAVEYNGTDLTGSVAIPRTGGHQTWVDLTTPTFMLPAGSGTLKLLMQSDGFNINQFRVDLIAAAPTAATPDAVARPITIQAEDYTAFADNSKGNSGKVYRGDDVDIQPTQDDLTPNGYNVGWIRTDEWLAYDVNVAAAGPYTLTLRVGTPYSNGSFAFDYNGQRISGAIAIPKTGGHQSWADITTDAFTLPAGPGVLTLVFLSDGFNLNQFTLTPAAAMDQPAAPPAAPITEPIAEPNPAPVTPTPTPAPASCPTTFTRVIDVTNTAQLNDAFKGVQPGDQIRLADGVYQGRFTVVTSGTAAAPISICGERGAVLDGGGVSGGDVLKLRASYWTVSGFTITNALRGLVIEGGNYNVLRGLELHTFGQEAMHIHKMSSNNLVDSNWIHDTGKLRAEYGEGVYVGTHSGNWARDNGGRVDTSDWNVVQYNLIGPNVTAEHVESKEGTTGTLIQGNTFDGTGMLTGKEYIDSWVTVKGNDAVVRDNRGTAAPMHGFRVLGTDIDGWGDNNAFYNNVADVQSAGYGFKISPSSVGVSGTIVSCNNMVSNAGKGLTDIKCTP